MHTVVKWSTLEGEIEDGAKLAGRRGSLEEVERVGDLSATLWKIVRSI